MIGQSGEQKRHRAEESERLKKRVAGQAAPPVSPQDNKELPYDEV
jgi:hypothetical protein